MYIKKDKVARAVEAPALPAPVEITPEVLAAVPPARAPTPRPMSAAEQVGLAMQAKEHAGR